MWKKIDNKIDRVWGPLDDGDELMSDVILS